MNLCDRVLPEKKNKKKKKKKTKESDEGVVSANQIATTVENQNLSTLKKKGKEEAEETEAKPSQVRTFPNGLVIEELSMGKPNGKRAAPGKKVSPILMIEFDVVY